MCGLSLKVKKLSKLNKSKTLFNSVELSKKCTMKVGGKAKYYLEISTIERFIKIMDFLKEKNIPYFILGNGSNVVFSDKGFDGAIIKLVGDFARFDADPDGEIECGAGLSLGVAINKTVDLRLAGMEDGVGIPGTIGGAVFMNAGAFNFEMSKVVKYVVAYVNEKITYFDRSDCNFGYRYSIFQDNNAIILRVGLDLNKSELDLKERINEIIRLRSQSQPINLPSAGSVFKRQDGIVVSKMLDELGVKGKMIGGAKVSEKHANFIVNFNQAKAQDVYLLMKTIKRDFALKFNIELKPEIKFVGEFDETIG